MQNLAPLLQNANLLIDFGNDDDWMNKMNELLDTLEGRVDNLTLKTEKINGTSNDISLKSKESVELFFTQFGQFLCSVQNLKICFPFPDKCQHLLLDWLYSPNPYAPVEETPRKLSLFPFDGRLLLELINKVRFFD